MPSRYSSQPASPWMQLLERHGISTLLLVAGGYYVLHTVVEPMVETAQKFVGDIRECNLIIQNELMTNQAETLERWKQVWEILEIKKGLVQQALTKVEEIDRDLERIEARNLAVSDEIGKLRMLLIRSPVEDK